MDAKNAKLRLVSWKSPKMVYAEAMIFPMNEDGQNWIDENVFPGAECVYRGKDCYRGFILAPTSLQSTLLKLFRDGGMLV